MGIWHSVSFFGPWQSIHVAPPSCLHEMHIHTSKTAFFAMLARDTIEYQSRSCERGERVNLHFSRTTSFSPLITHHDMSFPQSVNTLLSDARRKGRRAKARTGVDDAARDAAPASVGVEGVVVDFGKTGATKLVQQGGKWGWGWALGHDLGELLDLCF